MVHLVMCASFGLPVRPRKLDGASCSRTVPRDSRIASVISIVLAEGRRTARLMLNVHLGARCTLLRCQFQMVACIQRVLHICQLIMCPVVFPANIQIISVHALLQNKLISHQK